MRSLVQTNGNLFDLMDDFLKNVNHEVLKVDIVEDESSYRVYADVPGVAKEKIKVNFNKGILTIEIEEKTQTERKEGEKLLHSERTYSRKSRSFNLGDGVDESAIEAESKEGVLVLTLPKKENLKVVKAIEVK